MLPQENFEVNLLY